jgi:hypothetical protein
MASPRQHNLSREGRDGPPRNVRKKADIDRARVSRSTNDMRGGAGVAETTAVYPHVSVHPAMHGERELPTDD